jgi:D-serine deaminase-like pyridoxal phosphate-dependent protein
VPVYPKIGHSCAEGSARPIALGSAPPALDVIARQFQTPRPAAINRAGWRDCGRDADGRQKTSEMIDCMSAETARQDARLNENYKRLIAARAPSFRPAVIFDHLRAGLAPCEAQSFQGAPSPRLAVFAGAA